MADFRELGYSLAEGLDLYLAEPESPPEFASRKSSVVKQKQCKKGYNCGGSCISKFKKCRKVLSKQAQKHGNWIEKKAKPKLASWTKTKKAEEAKAKQVEAKAEKIKVKQSTEKQSTKPVKKIKSYKEFEGKILETYDRLNKDYNLDGLVEIYRMRREIGDRVSRGQFQDWLLEAQANDIFELMGGSVPDNDPKKLQDSVSTELGGLSVYAKRIK